MLMFWYTNWQAYLPCSDATNNWAIATENQIEWQLNVVEWVGLLDVKQVAIYNEIDAQSVCVCILYSV